METGNSMYELTANISKAMLDELCTDECKSSISSYREQVLEACSNDEFHDRGNATDINGSSGVYAPIVLADYYFTNYYQRCLTNVRGEYCMLYLQSTDSQDECDECGLKMFQVLLSDGYFYTEQMATEFQALTSSCGVSNLPLPTPIPVVISSSSAAPSTTPSACADRRVNISPGETCDTFAAANNASTWGILIENGLQGGCVNFPTTGSLCVSGNCTTHAVTANDTCQSVAKQYGISITQFISWSYVLNPICSNFNLLVGHQVCVSYPGGAPSEINSWGSGAVGGTASTAAPVPTDVAPGVNEKCGRYYLVKENDYCQVIAVAQGIKLDDFLFLNSQLDTNCTNLWLNYSYCVQPVGSIETYPGYAATTISGTPVSTTTPWWVGQTGTALDWDSLPDATTLTPWTPVPTPTSAPLANGTRKDCVEYKDNNSAPPHVTGSFLV
ncbi:hypothetical protein BDV12DRAFT_194679 [Aspergillus spectabilis]